MLELIFGKSFSGTNIVFFLILVFLIIVSFRAVRKFINWYFKFDSMERLLQKIEYNTRKENTEGHKEEYKEEPVAPKTQEQIRKTPVFNYPKKEEVKTIRRI